jgi:ABC-type glycerol-3-phosphate transport system substrate-binding protein
MATLGQGYILEAQKAGMRFGVVPEPLAPGSDERYVNAWSLTSSIWKETQHPEEAWKFLSYWVGPQGQRHLMETSNLFPSIPSVLADIPNADAEEMQAFFNVLDYPLVASWDNPRPCKNNVLRAAREVWDLIMLGQIERDEIGAKLDALVPAAQAALDECRPRLGG